MEWFSISQLFLLCIWQEVDYFLLLWWFKEEGIRKNMQFTMWNYSYSSCFRGIHNGLFFFISLWLCNSCEFDCAQKQLVWSASPVKLTTQSNLNSNLFQGIWFHHLLCSHGSHAIYFHKILIHFLLVLLVLAFMIDLTFLFISCFIIIFLISIEFTFWTSFMKKY